MYVFRLKWLVNVVLMITGFTRQNTYAEELNLNFQQNDYQFKFDRLEVIHTDDGEILQDISCKTFKYNRSMAVVNATITPDVDFGNEVTVLTQVYKFMSNEYRFFPIHFQANLCKAFNADVMGFKSGFSRCGNLASFPMRKGIKYYLCNWYPDPSKLPPLIPDGQFKIEMKLLYSSKEFGILVMYGTVSRPIV